MSLEEKKLRPYIKARRQLLSLIDALRAKGESRLPSERALSDELDISLGTLKKVLRQLLVEGRVFAMPRKGNFISAAMPQLRVGIALEGGETSFLRSVSAFSGLMDVFHANGVAVHTINAKTPKKAFELCLHYGFDACVWHMPHPSRFAEIAEIMKSSPVPMVFVSDTFRREDEPFIPKPCFIMDFYANGRSRAEALTGRGHREIVYCGETKGVPSYESFLEVLASQGVEHDPSLNIEKLEDVATRLPLILGEGKATALVSDGGKTRIETVFKTLDELPNGAGVEILADDIGPELASLRAAYPKTNLVAVNFFPGRELGVKAGNALAGFLKRSIPMQSFRCCSQVRKPDGSPLE